MGGLSAMMRELGVDERRARSKRWQK